MDEKRRNFKPAVWNQQSLARGQTLEQVWFAGAHSDIGGGNASTALSDIPLGWMCEKIVHCGLSLNPIVLRPDAMGSVEESWKGFYHLIPRFYRPVDGRSSERGLTFETLHASVLEKLKRQPSYRPRNLMKYVVSI